ncbi:MAG TPA: M67 family metallopeptidase [Nitrososphaerales archaeon]|nr:M67 family metallopeptidase [Nitrososphaerales archaeon]
MIFIDQILLDSMFSHAVSTFPEECCGLMIGGFGEDASNKKVSSIKQIKNTYEQSERYHRYTIDPKEYMETEIEVQNRGEEIVGIYHSHPNAPAKPSKFDQGYAWPTLSYIVIEVRDRKPINVTSWILKEDRSEFLPEDLKIVGGSSNRQKDSSR